MINVVIEACARRKYIVFLLVIVALVLGLHAVQNTKLDALPDLSDTQVILSTQWDRSPDVIEDQVTYPLVTALLGMPKVKDIRAVSDFGASYVTVIFEEGTDIYWARARTLEYLNSLGGRLPKGAVVEMAKDATAIGWVFQYALVDRTGQTSLDALRSYQDWTLRFALQTVPGVAEVAALGGFVRQYQVTVDPLKLQAYKIPITSVVEALQKGNNTTGARLVEQNGRDYMVRGRGYITSLDDIRKIVVKAEARTGTPVLIRDVATVAFGPALRRGVAELDGEGETVGGVVIMRIGENAEKVIQRVKERIAEIQPTLPKGVEIVTTYDRSDLIERSMATLKRTLIEEVLIVSLVILIFLWHFPSAVVPILTIPITILLAFIPIQLSGMTANIMSLGGLAIAIGALVDAAIVVVEQTHKKLEQWQAGGRVGDYRRVVIDAVKEVGGPSFFALLVIAVSFLPVFTLEAQEGRLFTPLALTKTFAMMMAAVLAVTLDPALRLMLTRVDPFTFKPAWAARLATRLCVGKIHSEETHPISRPLMRLYQPVVATVLTYKKLTLLVAGLAMLATVPVFLKLGSEFMPPLDEGTLLYMPTTLPGLSVGEAARLLQKQDKIIKAFPEVERVFGKAGRAETATDPAPFSMMETTIILKPQSAWPKQERWYSAWMPAFLQDYLRPIWPDHKSTQELIYGPGGLNEALALPALASSWTMPIKGRIDMLTTGVRTPLGIKIQGDNLDEIERLGGAIERVLKTMPATTSAYAERTTGGYYLDFDFNREALARYGLSLDEAQAVLSAAVGGDTLTTTIEGRERYGVTLRYQRDFRSDSEALKRVLVATPSGAQVPMGQLATLVVRTGPSMIRDENGRLSGTVYVDFSGRDIGSYVAEAKTKIAAEVPLPTGYRLIWSGQYEAMERVEARLQLVLPLTFLAVFLLLLMNTKSVAKTGIILLAVPFSAIGAIWFVYLLGYNMSLAVWVGLIALMGVDAETAVFMMLYLDLAYQEAVKEGRMTDQAALHAAVITGAVKRLRPKVMTVACMLFGLLPIMLSDGAGSDVMKRIAAPMIGGILTSFVMELIVFPPLFALWKGYGLRAKKA